VSEGVRVEGSTQVGSLRARLIVPLGLVLAVVTIGTVGYRWLWRGLGGTWLDALFMTVTTITTIGYGEVKPLDAPARVFTMAIAVAGIGAFFYTFSVVLDHLVATGVADPRGRRRMERRIAELNGHVIVAGLGRVGRQAAAELAAAGTPFVVIDPSPTAARFAEENGYLALLGDATEDPMLDRAGVRRARGLVATTANDATNMYIVLSARVLNPALRIVSRADDDASVAKLLRAGADRAISPYATGGHRLAHLILSPTVVDFFETALRGGAGALAIEDLAVAPSSASAGRTLGALAVRQATGASVLAVLRDVNAIPNPPPDLTLQVGDRVLALGTTEQLQRLEKLLGTG
jgi:voltage-gated potassium channel